MSREPAKRANTEMKAVRAKAWAKVAIVAGLIALTSYFCSVVFKPFPWTVGRILFAFGPVSIISVVAFFKATEKYAGSIAHSLGTLFLVIAGAIVNVMAVVQDTQFTVFGAKIRNAPDPAAAELLEEILWGVNVVQSGLDVSWDVFVSSGTVLLAFSLMRHPAVGKVWGVLGATVGAAALALNLITFPSSPASAGLIDLGPGVGMWYAVILMLLFRSLRHWDATEVARP